jgi:predicted kinase
MLILVRGLPGSGKSTFAYGFSYTGNFFHYEADMFFYDDDGDYVFNPKKIKDAHEWCQRKTNEALADGRNVVVSNTFSQLWELQPYLDMADKYGVRVQVITCEGDYGNIHNVPVETVERMRKRWEKYTG